MPELMVSMRSGEQVTIQAESGISVMEAIRRGGVDEIMALCGGCCSCATCHVYVDPDMIGLLPQISETEDSLLDCAHSKSPYSRLACQIQMSDALDGLHVTVAPEN